MRTDNHAGKVKRARMHSFCVGMVTTRIRVAWAWVKRAGGRLLLVVPRHEWSGGMPWKNEVAALRRFDFVKYRVAPRLGTEAVRRRLSREVQSALLELRPRDSRL